MTTERRTDQRIGYGKPPGHTRFSKGQSGNPKGRPRAKSKPGSNHSTLLDRALSEYVSVTVNNERKRMTKFEAMHIQLANKAASGDRQAMQMVFKILDSRDTSLGASASQRASTEDAAQILMLKRLTVEERLELRRLIAKAEGDTQTLNDDSNSDRATVAAADARARDKAHR